MMPRVLLNGTKKKNEQREYTLRMYRQNLCVDVPPISIELRFGIWEQV